jgi:alanine dehydrogenase
MRRDPHLAEGLNVHGGKVNYKAVADELGYEHTPIADLLG